MPSEAYEGQLWLICYILSKTDKAVRHESETGKKGMRFNDDPAD